MADMMCPNCGTVGLDISVIDSALNKEEGYLRRRFDCNSCQNRFFTYEVPLSPEVARQVDAIAKARQVTWSELIGEMVTAATRT